ncbi:MAG: hypothetical protein HS113_28540 [Verrucomicrobiales bacterium]|nr:hypothetical protein [Verrucomicrobiales bacterium]
MPQIALARGTWSALIAIALHLQVPSLAAFARGSKPVLTGWLALLLFAVQGAAVSPDRPLWLPDDAGGTSHDCAAARLEAGLLKVPLLTVTVTAVIPGRAVRAVLPGSTFEKARLT